MHVLPKALLYVEMLFIFWHIWYEFICDDVRDAIIYVKTDNMVLFQFEKHRCFSFMLIKFLYFRHTRSLIISVLSHNSLHIFEMDALL